MDTGFVASYGRSQIRAGESRGGGCYVVDSTLNEKHKDMCVIRNDVMAQALGAWLAVNLSRRDRSSGSGVRHYDILRTLLR